MALSANTVLEVRTTGDDTNGGGFVTGASGTDWSQQDSPQYSVTDGVTAGTTTLTSITAAFGTDVVGNLICIQGGTGSITADWYQIISRTNSTTIIVDRSTGLTAGVGVTLKIGGALLTPGKALALMVVGGMFTWIKSGTYLLASGLTFTASLFNAINRLKGYTITRGDSGTRPILRANASSMTILAAGSNAGAAAENLDLDGNNQTGSLGAYGFTSYWGSGLYNCLIRNCKAGGANLASLTNCEVTGCSVTTAVIPGGRLSGCYIHDNTITGVDAGSNGSSVVNCIITNNTGAASDGITTTAGVSVWGCTIYGNGRHGISVTTYSTDDGPVSRNVIYGNGGYGLSLPFISYGPVYNPAYDGNAYGSNTSGARNNTVACPHDVILTADPFTNKVGNDFSLNNTAGGGAACRAAAFPGATFPGGTTVGYPDIGAVQHQDSGGGGVSFLSGF